MRSISGFLICLLEKVVFGDEDFRMRVLGDIKGNRVDDLYLWLILRSEELKCICLKDKDDILKVLKEILDDIQYFCDCYLDCLLNSYDLDIFWFIKNVFIWVVFQEDVFNIMEFNIVLVVVKVMCKFLGVIIIEKQLVDCFDENFKVKVDFYCGLFVNFVDGCFLFFY